MENAPVLKRVYTLLLFVCQNGQVQSIYRIKKHTHTSDILALIYDYLKEYTSFNRCKIEYAGNG